VKKLLWALGLILVLVAGYAASGPLLTLWAIKTAVAGQDSARLAEHVDFPVLRQNLKDQLNAALAKSVAAKAGDNPFSTLVAGFAAKMVDGLVESFVTPGGIAALVEGKQPGQKAKEGTAPARQESLLGKAKFSYDSLSRFSVRVPDDKGKEVRLVLQRKGFSWKLVNIVLPLEDLP
jgi:hypothetical protein